MSIILNGKQIQYVKDVLKPLLKQDKLIQVRQLLVTSNTTWKPYSLVYKDSQRIIAWLYTELGSNTYFQNSQQILPLEFLYYPETTFDIPDNIKVIGYAAFGNSKIKQLYIPDSVHTISNNVFAHSDINTLIFENFNKVHILDSAFEDSSVKNIYVDASADDEKIEIWQKWFQYPHPKATIYKDGQLVIDRIKEDVI